MSDADLKAQFEKIADSARTAADKVEAAAECLDVACDGVDDRELAALDLGYPAGRDGHGPGVTRRRTGGDPAR